MTPGPQRPRPRPAVRDAATGQVGWVLTAALTAVMGLSLWSSFGNGSAASSPVDGDTETSSADGTDAVDDGLVNDVDESFVISVSGDILIHRRVAEAAADGAGGYDFVPLFEPVRSLIETRDFAICHLEVPLSGTNADLAFGESADGGAFRSPNQLADALRTVGFDTCSVASNHAYDSGESSVLNTVEQLNRVGLPHVGISATDDTASRLWQFRVKNHTIGHLSYTYGLNGRDPGTVPTTRVAQIDEATILADATRHRAAGSEFVIVSLHWGDEFVTGLNTQQATLGQTLIESPDIDLIVGHHAHVPQPVLAFGGEYVAYGLGNLLSNQSSSAPECPNLCPLESQDGVLLDFVVDRNDAGQLTVVDAVANPTWVDVGGTWKVIATDAPPLVGAELDTQLLAESGARTRATLAIPAPS